jgi:multimeric flavodoxin WrbA
MSRKKVLILEGSPRKNGNSAVLAGQVAAGAKDAGAEVETIFLHGLSIQPCSACEACKGAREDDCTIEDDMKPLYPKIRSADALVFASPIYFFTMSAQTKLFIDRCYALGATTAQDTYETDFAGKKIGIVLTYGDVDPFRSGAVNALRTFQDMFQYVGSEIMGMVYGTALSPGEIRSNTDLMKEAYDLGKQLGTNPTTE